MAMKSRSYYPVWTLFKLVSNKEMYILKALLHSVGDVRNYSLDYSWYLWYCTNHIETISHLVNPRIENTSIEGEYCKTTIRMVIKREYTSVKFGTRNGETDMMRDTVWHR